MKIYNTRPNHIEQALIKMHLRQWFGWTDSKNKVYANLALAPKMMNVAGDLIDNPHSLPSESDCNAGVAALQADWDSKEYARKRKAKYDALNQDEMRFDDTKNSTTTWVAAIDAIKSEFPKP